jgi:predicted nucleic acid-binding protein
VGALTLPATGNVYVDANAVIYAVEKIEPFTSLLQPLWLAAQAGRLQIATSELTWLEVLTKPLREGNATLESLFRAFLTAREVRLIPATLPLWEHAARLRALGLKTPDALHGATALAVGCALFLTNDATFRRVPGLPVAVLADVATS